VFVEKVRGLKPGELAPSLLRTGAGFHALKLVDGAKHPPFSITQTHARHILLRPSPQLSQEAAMRAWPSSSARSMSRSKTFEQLARENSEDGSAPPAATSAGPRPASSCRSSRSDERAARSAASPSPSCRASACT
jgi:hypothetical protein